MSGNIFKMVLRLIKQQKTFVFINIMGFAIGLACCIFIALYVFHELSYDRHHKDADLLYRLSLKAEMSGSLTEAATSGGPLGRTLTEEIPEIVNFTHVHKKVESVLLEYNDKRFYQEQIIYADSNFFEIFNYEFLQGDAKTVFNEPFSIVLTESTSKKYFGNKNPIGKIIQWDKVKPFVVTGIIKDPEFPSHLNFEMLVSFGTLLQTDQYRYLFDSWYAFTTINYIKLKQEYPQETIQEKVNQLIEKYMGEGMKESGSKIEFLLQPVTSIHLNSNLKHELEQNNQASRVYILSVVALLILVIASINFVNLSTARSSVRALEVGVRKTYGATQGVLFRQFMIESAIITLLSLIAAIMLVELFFPLMNNISGQLIFLTHLQKAKFLLITLAITILVGFLSGIYPSVFLASYNPVKVLYGDTTVGSRSKLFRNTLVVIQFAISVFLIISTMVIYKQVAYLSNKDIGIEKENLLVIPLRNSKMIENYKEFKSDLINIPGVLDVTGATNYLGNFDLRRGFYYEGRTRENIAMLLFNYVDPNYLKVMNVNLVKGRHFMEDSQLDSNAVIINRAMFRETGWKNPLGKHIYVPKDESDDHKLKVIGIVDNFNYASLHEDVKPLMIMQDYSYIRYMYVKLKEGDKESLLKNIRSKWETFYPEHPFNYFFQDNKYDELYTAEMRMVDLFTVFTLLAIIVAVLGLFGLVSFTIVQRTREIGIRKAMGSSVLAIEYMLTKEFAGKVLIANLLAWPAAWFFMDKWLQNFAYRINISWWMFLIAAFISMIIALGTVSFHAIKAARANPSEALKYE